MGSKFFPSDSTKKDASSPSKYSSISILFCIAVSFFSKKLSIALKAVFWSIATITPLPAAKPSNFITIGTPCFTTYSLAFFTLLKNSKFAVGAPIFLHKSFVNFFELSNFAASFEHPNTVIPPFLSRSDSPFSSGPSGPIITRSTLLFCENSSI